MATKDGDFNRGICECGNTIFRLNAKYAIGKLVKSPDNRALVWQWYCNACGMVHHEPCQITEHRILKNRTDDHFEDPPNYRPARGRSSGLEHIDH